MSQSATPATQNAAASQRGLGTKRATRANPVPRLPRKVTIHVLTSATPASATPATQSDDPCHQVPRLPHKVKVDVTKCHACHTKRRGVPARPGNQARHQSQPSAISATPATQSDDPCHQVPRLPHKVKVDVTKCHACHAKRRGVPARPGNQARHQSQPSATSATPATQSDDPCVDKCHACKCHACHAK